MMRTTAQLNEIWPVRNHPRVLSLYHLHAARKLNLLARLSCVGMMHVFLHRQTGGWGSLEYGTPVSGQVVGGRWKPLHHMMEQSAYADVTAACGKSSVTMMDTGEAAAVIGRPP